MLYLYFFFSPLGNYLQKYFKICSSHQIKLYHLYASSKIFPSALFIETTAHRKLNHPPNIKYCQSKHYHYTRKLKFASIKSTYFPEFSYQNPLFLRFCLKRKLPKFVEFQEFSLFLAFKSDPAGITTSSRFICISEYYHSSLFSSQIRIRLRHRLLTCFVLNCQRTK